jgi:hypothetical protein
MVDGRKIEGWSAGINANQLSLYQESGKQLVMPFNWVDRIVPC